MTNAELKDVLEKHAKYLADDSDGVKADLSDANLRWADLRGANLDYSVFFLGCKTFGIKTCKRLPFQLAYHICRMKSDDAEIKEMQRLLAPFANKSHVIETHDLPKIEDGGEVE